MSAMAGLVFDSVLPQLQHPSSGPCGHCGQTPAAEAQNQWTNRTVVGVLRQLPRSQWEQRYQRVQEQRGQQDEHNQRDQQQWQPMGQEDGDSLSDSEAEAEGGDGHQQQQAAEFEAQPFEFEGDESGAVGGEFATDEFGQPQPFAAGGGGLGGRQMEAEGNDSNEFDPQYYQPQQ